MIFLPRAIKKTVSVHCPVLRQDVDILAYYSHYEIQDRTYDEMLAFVCPHTVRLQCEQECIWQEYEK